MAAPLLERDADLAVLMAALAAARAGHGSLVLVSGEAGIGKSSLVRAFRDAVGREARLLVGACDDLHTRRTLGPLRDAARHTGGPLERALGDRETGDVFAAAVAELDLPPVTVLVVEDVHWVDDATLDVLRHLARRVSARTGVLVLTYRPDEIDPGHPLRVLLGELGGATVHRIALAPLSERAVETVAGGEVPGLHALTGGNPFFVTEALAAPSGSVPRTISDAVLARLGRLSAPARAACEQLAVVPTVVDFSLANALLGGSLDVLDEAERAGVIRISADGLAFRHELARRALAARLPRIRLGLLNQAVVRALLAAPVPDLDRVVHHAVEAGDVAPSSRTPPTPDGQRPARAPTGKRSSTSRRLSDTSTNSTRPVRRGSSTTTPGSCTTPGGSTTRSCSPPTPSIATSGSATRSRWGEALVRLSRHHYMAGATARGRGGGAAAVTVLAGRRCAADRLAYALAAHGSVLALTERSAEALDVLARARGLAAEANRHDLVAMCLNYVGMARVDLDGEPGLAALRESLELALRSGTHEFVARGYTNLAEPLYRLGHLDELEPLLDDGLTFTRERGFGSHAYNLEVHRCLLQMRRGEWDEAEARAAGPRRRTDHGNALRLQRAAVRPAARPPRPARGRAAARRRRGNGRLAQRSAIGLVLTGLAVVEWAWLTGRPERADRRHRGAAAPPRPRRVRPGRRGAAALPRACRTAGGALSGVPGAVGGGAARRLAGRRGRVGRWR